MIMTFIKEQIVGFPYRSRSQKLMIKKLMAVLKNAPIFITTGRVSMLTDRRDLRWGLSTPNLWQSTKYLIAPFHCYLQIWCIDNWRQRKYVYNRLVGLIFPI